MKNTCKTKTTQLNAISGKHSALNNVTEQYCLGLHTVPEKCIELCNKETGEVQHTIKNGSRVKVTFLKANKDRDHVLVDLNVVEGIVVDIGWIVYSDDRPSKPAFIRVYRSDSKMSNTVDILLGSIIDIAIFG